MSMIMVTKGRVADLSFLSEGWHMDVTVFISVLLETTFLGLQNDKNKFTRVLYLMNKLPEI